MNKEEKLLPDRKRQDGTYGGLYPRLPRRRRDACPQCGRQGKQITDDPGWKAQLLEITGEERETWSCPNGHKWDQSIGYGQ